MDNQQQRQDHFNKAYLGVIAQGEPAVDKATGRCQYLSESGSKCNVGHILTDEELEKWGDFAGGVTHLCHEKIGSKEHPIRSDKDFYIDMQEVHDNLYTFTGSYFVGQFKQNMKLFAAKYKLEVPEHE